MRAALALRRLLPQARCGRSVGRASVGSAAWPPDIFPTAAAVLARCVQSVVFGDVNAATARVLAADGYDVAVPRAQGCCGALHAHAGRLEEGVARARALERALGGYDAIVTNAAGCGSHLKDHGIAARRRRLRAARRSRRRRHSGSRCRSASRSRTRATSSTRSASRPSRAPLARSRSSRCSSPATRSCAAAARASTTSCNRKRRAELGDRKAAHVLANGAGGLRERQPGCLVQVTAAFRRAGRPLPAFHPVELVDASIRGLCAPRCWPAARR